MVVRATPECFTAMIPAMAGISRGAATFAGRAGISRSVATPARVEIVRGVAVAAETAGPHCGVVVIPEQAEISWGLAGDSRFRGNDGLPRRAGPAGRSAGGDYGWPGQIDPTGRNAGGDDGWVGRIGADGSAGGNDEGPMPLPGGEGR